MTKTTTDDGGWPADSSLQRLVERIHAHPLQLVLAVTGGGSAALSELLTVPGASRTVLEAAVPYSQPALAAWLGATPEHACSNRTARAMAMVAFERAQRWRQSSGASPPSLAGVACTASLVSDRPKRGAHRIHVACQTFEATTTFDLDLEKGGRERAAEERLATALVLRAIAAACGFDDAALPLRPTESVVRTHTVASKAWQRLLCGETAAALTVAGQPTPGGEIPAGCVAPLPARVIFPGAFNPLHEGHLGMARVAAEKLGLRVEYELSIRNVDKPPLDYCEIECRLARMPADSAVWLTSAPTFVQKARLFPGATFVVGLDTLERIAAARYYQNNAAERDAALGELACSGCRFLVFGRALDGQFRSLAEAALPAELQSRCEMVSGDEFRCDLSSTELRQRQRDE